VSVGVSRQDVIWLLQVTPAQHCIDAKPSCDVAERSSCGPTETPPKFSQSIIHKNFSIRSKSGLRRTIVSHAAHTGMRLVYAEFVELIQNVNAFLTGSQR
jgi:hypothetical protein